MDGFHNEIFNLPEWTQLIRVSARLLIAAVLGGWIGFERQRERKAAGLRTHILVAMGAALFAIAPLEAGMTISDAGRVFQGIATGIGFIGAGTILKLTEQQEIKGLTTAAGLWLTRSPTRVPSSAGGQSYCPAARQKRHSPCWWWPAPQSPGAPAAAPCQRPTDWE